MQRKQPKLYFRGTPRPEVFPFGGTDGEDTRKVINPLKGKTDYGWHLEQNIYDPEGITRTVKAGGGSGNMPKVIVDKCNCNEGGECKVCCIGCGEHKEQCTCGEIHQLNQPKHSNDRVYGTDGVSPTLNTMQGGNRQPFIAAERGRYNEDGSTSQKLEGRKDGVSNTLTSVEKDNRVVEGAKIRRLTPVECERLQSFPDNWTNVEGLSDTQRYKTLGNAVTVNVIKDIMRYMI